MLQLMARNWWMLVLRGACAILFGIFAWTWPGVTLGVLIVLWGLYAFADGVLAFAAAFTGAAGRPWWALIVEGLVSFGAAAAAIFFPGVSAVVLLYLIAAWAIVTGVLEIVAAIQLRKEIKGELWLGLAGVASLLFGFLLFTRPGAGALAVVWIIGTYAVAFGALLVALGFRVKTLNVRPA
jgi:uncharacterized membrane protein HdeD (DUF308 family)